MSQIIRMPESGLSALRNKFGSRLIGPGRISQVAEAHPLENYVRHIPDVSPELIGKIILVALPKRRLSFGEILNIATGSGIKFEQGFIKSIREICSPHLEEETYAAFWLVAHRRLTVSQLSSQNPAAILWAEFCQAKHRNNQFPLRIIGG